MNNFIVNLAQRGAGLGPWAAGPSGGLHPEPYAGLSSYDRAGDRRAAGSEDTTRPSGKPFGGDPSEVAVTREAQAFSKQPDIGGNEGAAVTTGDVVRTATAPQGKTALSVPVNDRSSEGPHSSASPTFLPKSNNTYHPRSGVQAEEPAEETIRLQHAPEPADQKIRKNSHLENHASLSTETPLQASAEPTPSPTAAAADLHTGLNEHIRQSTGITGIQARKPVDRFADRIEDDLEPTSHRKFEMQSDDLKESAMPQLYLLQKPSLEEDKKPFGPVRITAAQSPMMTAAESASTLNIGVRGTAATTPAVDQAVQVRIGKVEVRAVHPPKKTPPRTNPVSRPAGFDEYYSVRNYIYREL